MNTLRRLASPGRWLQAYARMRSGSTVMAGPFAGMKYIERSQWSAYTPKLVGTYERELNEAIGRWLQDPPGLVVDIGAAEGYYAVGVALRLPGTRVVCFEASPEAQAMCAELSAKNQVMNLEIRGRCSSEDLSEVLGTGRSVGVICDVEGFEVELLDPKRVPALRFARLLVETHDTNVPGCAATLRKRFEASHEIRAIAQQPRSIHEWPFRWSGRRIAPGWITFYGLSEWRTPGNAWLWMEPRTSASAATQELESEDQENAGGPRRETQ